MRRASSSICFSTSRCVVHCTIALTSTCVLHAVVRTEDGRMFPHSFVPEMQIKHKCANGRLPCASSFPMFNIKPTSVPRVLYMCN